MTAMLWVGLALALILIIAAPLEGARQRRAMRRRGEKTTGTRAIGAGMLELQQLLQPDRKVEIVQRQQKGEEVAGEEEDASGEE